MNILGWLRNLLRMLPAHDTARLPEYRLDEKRSAHYHLQGASDDVPGHQTLFTVARAIAYIEARLRERDMREADRVAACVWYCYPKSRYKVIRQCYWEYHRADILRDLEALLEATDFAAANDLAAQSLLFVTDAEYEGLKAPAVRRYFMERYHYAVNDEQAHALACPARNVLVRARAGTGKTRTIVAKAVLAIEEERLRPDQVLMLAFNRDAANEMLKRMRKEFALPKFATATTFHSLAYRLIWPGEDIPSDDDEKAAIVEMALGRLWSPRFRKLVDWFFRAEEDPRLAPDRELGDGQYYDFRRNVIMNEALGGYLIKSNGEKWIADFLFDHGIRHRYEQVHWWNDRPYRPDFTVFSEEGFATRAIIEHWGVSARQKDSDPFGESFKTVGDYRKEREKKRLYWKGRKISLIETSVDDMSEGREAFLVCFKERLEAHGIVCVSLSDAELMERLKRRYWNKLTRLLVQLIQRAKNRLMSPDDVRRVCRRLRRGSLRTRLFWVLAERVYQEYEHVLHDQNRLEFQDLLTRAAAKIDESNGEMSFLPKHGDDSVNLSELRWLMIDEYQDFSPGFNWLVQAMLRHNPHLRLFCVGDDWQAINRFAGSEPAFFRDFKTNHAPAAEALLQINHRSRPIIVETSNQLMAGMGQPGQYLSDGEVGRVQQRCLEQESPPDSSEHGRYDNGYMRARFRELCCRIITDCGPDVSTIAILCRTNWVYGQDLPDFQQELESMLKQFGKHTTICVDTPQVSTVHKYKGRQAHVVIVANVTAGAFPLIHKNTELFTPFLPEGADPYAEELIDERRLFYVALTRAERELWIITEGGRRSPFLVELELSEPPPGDGNQNGISRIPPYANTPSSILSSRPVT